MSEINGIVDSIIDAAVVAMREEIDGAKTRPESERPIPSTNEIEMFFHCGLCLEEKPDDVTPQEWARLDTGWTLLGFQVWCRRHACNVAHVVFEGHQHPANTSPWESDDAK